MAKAKYKLGTLVEVQNPQTGNAQMGTVDGILLTEKGYAYRFKGDDSAFVGEPNIINAYRPVVARKQAKTKAVSTAKRPTSKPRIAADREQVASA